MSSYVDILCRQSSIGILEFVALGPGLLDHFYWNIWTDCLSWIEWSLYSSRTSGLPPFPSLKVCLWRRYRAMIPQRHFKPQQTLPPHPFCLAPLQLAWDCCSIPWFPLPLTLVFIISNLYINPPWIILIWQYHPFFVPGLITTPSFHHVFYYFLLFTYLCSKHSHIIYCLPNIQLNFFRVHSLQNSQ